MGAVLRLLMVELSDEVFMKFPWMTLAINLLGSGALGLLVGVSHAWSRLPKWTIPVLGTGLLGSFTTFSTVVLAVVLAQDRELFTLTSADEVIPPGLFEMVAYLLISVIFCTAAAAAGMTIGRAIFGCTGMQCKHGGDGP